MFSRGSQLSLVGDVLIYWYIRELFRPHCRLFFCHKETLKICMLRLHLIDKAYIELSLYNFSSTSVVLAMPCDIYTTNNVLLLDFDVNGL